MKTFIKATAVSLITAAFLLSSCSNTKLLSSYTAPDSKLPENSKVLVMAMMGDQDKNYAQTWRKSWLRIFRQEG